MTKLLHKPLRAFTLYALIILVISIPVYVIVVDYIWTNELDEHNWLTLQHTKEQLSAREFSSDEIKIIDHIWGTLQPGVTVSRVTDNRALQDSIYEITRPNKYDPRDKEDRFRGLISFVEINGEPYQLSIETNVEESNETFWAIAILTSFFFLLLVVGFILLNRNIAKKAWSSFYQTLHSLRLFKLGRDNKLDLPDTDIKEFQELHHSLDQLVKNNVDTYHQQKSFTENASHELQTPLALLRSKLDLLLQEEHLSPEISEIVGGIEAPLSRMSRINKNLLLLAKVENNQYEEKEELDVKTYLESSIHLFEDYLNDKQLTLTTHISGPVIVTGNSFLLETLLHNFISNAIRHTTNEGQIDVKLVERQLSFSNSGNAPLNANQIFKRFSTAGQTRVSSGLGLAIIKEIADSYRWQLDYRFQDGSHTFTLTF